MVPFSPPTRAPFTRRSPLIIAGYTTGLDITSLQLVQAEWLNSRPIETRIENIRGTGSGPRENDDVLLITSNTGVRDVAVDSVFGGDDDDWFMIDPDEDLALDIDPALDLVVEPGF